MVAFGWEGWFVLAVIAVAFVVMLMDLIPTDFVMLMSLNVIMSAGIVSTSQGLEGFANESVLVVAVLYVVAAGISGTGALDYLMNKLLGTPKRLVTAQLSLMLPVSCISCFMNNTPVVAVMIPIVQQWARRIHMAPSLLFIPLSFASILGGTCSLIGTSTNLVLAGKAAESPEFQEQNITIGIFDVAIAGLPTLFMGFSYVVLFSPCLLPDARTLETRNAKNLGETDAEETGANATEDDQNQAKVAYGINAVSQPNQTEGQQRAESEFHSHRRGVDEVRDIDALIDGENRGIMTSQGGMGFSYTAGCVVLSRSQAVGKSVEDAGLRGLDGLYLTSVQRGDRLLGPQAVGPEFVILENDVLFFAGLLDQFASFCSEFDFVPITDIEVDEGNNADAESSDGGTESETGYHSTGYLSRGSLGVRRRRRRRRGQKAANTDQAFAGLNSSTMPKSAAIRKPKSSASHRASSMDVGNCTDPGAASEPTGHVVRESSAVLSSDDESGTEEGRRLREAKSHRPVRKPPGFLNHHVVKARICANSALAGKTPKEVKFRERYNAAILSIVRSGEKKGIMSGPGHVVLEEGDVMLLMIGRKFNWEQECTKADLECVLHRADRATSRSDPMSPGMQVPAAVGENQVMDENTDVMGEAELQEIEREFLFSMVVLDSSRLKGSKSLVGRSVGDSGLRGLPGLFLVAIESENGEVDHACGSDAVLQKNDVLWFAGERSAVDTLRRIPGLEETKDTQVHKLKVNLLQRRLVEAVLSLRSDMIGKTIKEARFRTRFDAAVIAVHRKGARVISKIGDIQLLAGDVLLLDTGPNFMTKFRDNSNFLLVSEVENSTPPQFDKFYIALFAVVGMMVAYLLASEHVSLFVCAVYAAAIIIGAGCITMTRARSSVNWEVIVTIACAFGLSNAMEESGVADAIGSALVDLAVTSGTGEVGVLTAIYLATFLLSIVVANNAAALLMYPIALNACSTLGYDLERMLYTLMLAASSSFTSPFGYQTNLMVYGPGRYVFADFVKFGFPMQFWQMVFSIVFLIYDEYWYGCWVGAIGFCIIACVSMGFIPDSFVARTRGCCNVACSPWKSIKRLVTSCGKQGVDGPSLDGQPGTDMFVGKDGIQERSNGGDSGGSHSEEGVSMV